MTTYSTVTYTGNGATQQYAVPFPYIDRAHVTALVSGVNTSFTWLSDGLVYFNTAPANGASVILSRNSARGTRLVDFQDAEVLTESSLDLAYLQSLYIAQEAFDASNVEAINIASQAYAVAASASASSAAASASSAGASAAGASTSASNAASSASAAGASATGAGTSASNAAASASTASTSASNAAASAATVAAAENYTAPYTGAVSRTWGNKNAEIATPKDFGPTPGLTELQRLFDSGAPRIVIPYGNYTITDTLVFTGGDRTVIDFCGSVITLNDATGLKDAIKVGAGTGGPYSVVLANGTITRAQVATAGAAIKSDRANGIRLINMSVAGASKMFMGVYFYRTVDGWLFGGSQIEHCVSDGVRTLGTDGTTNASNVHVFDSMIQYNGGHGLSISDWTMGSSVFRNTLFANGGLGIALDASDPAHVGGDFEVCDNNIDTNTLGGFYCDKHGNVRLNDNWFSSNGAANITVKPASSQFVIGNNLLYSATPNYSMDLEGDNMVINANLLYGGDTGIKLRAGASVVTVTNNIIRGMAQWGIDKTLGPDKVTIGGNQYDSNGAGNVSSGGTNITTF